MLVRKLAAASVELLVMAVGAAIAAPYVLILVSPFISVASLLDRRRIR